MTTIHLHRLLPDDCSTLPDPRREDRHMGVLFGLASDRVYNAVYVTANAVGSYPAFSPLPVFAYEAVCFLLHFPSGYPGRALPAVVSS